MYSRGRLQGKADHTASHDLRSEARPSRHRDLGRVVVTVPEQRCLGHDIREGPTRLALADSGPSSDG